MRPPSLSCKIFLGGIPHDLNPSELFFFLYKKIFYDKILIGDLQERLESFGSVRLEWPNKDNMPMHRNSLNSKIIDSLFLLKIYFMRLVMAGFVYAVYENEESVHQILHTCSTKTDRTLDDGRCEYYLDVYSQRTTSRRKNVRKIAFKNSYQFFFFFLDSNYSLVCGKYLI
jgi:hypothetical protein